jgi:predicted histone-like DNA-binding protein
MARLLFKMYQNNIDNDKTNGKYYARIVHTETLGIDKLAEHIAEHGSVYTEDVVYGVLKKFSTCLLEMLLESKKVKIDGLGTFYLSACSSGSETVDEFSADNIKSLRVRFLPERVDNKLTGKNLRKKARLVNIEQWGVDTTSSGGGGNDDDMHVVEQPGI